MTQIRNLLAKYDVIYKKEKGRMNDVGRVFLLATTGFNANFPLSYVVGQEIKYKVLNDTDQ